MSLPFRMNRLLQFRPSVARLASRSFFGSVEKVEIEITNRANETHIVKARVGDSLHDTIIDNMVEYEGYAICGGGVACSTCHIGKFFTNCSIRYITFRPEIALLFYRKHVKEWGK